MRTDRVDLVHLHNFGDEKIWGDRKLVFGDNGAVAALREAKRQGVVRFIGASGHLHPTCFDEVLDSGEVDVLMNAVNFVVRHTYDFEHKVWSRARHMNLGLVAMKVLGGPRESRGNSSSTRNTTSRRSATRPRCPALPSPVIGLEEHRRAREGRIGGRPREALSAEEDLALARVGLDLAGSPEWKAVYGMPLA